MTSGKSANGQVSAWPWTLEIEGRRAHYTALAAAAQALRAARATNRKVSAIGILGVPDEGGDAADLLDPQGNLRRGASLIARGVRTHPGDTALGIGSYRYTEPGEARAFGTRVLALANALDPASSPNRIRSIRTANGGQFAECLPKAKRAVAVEVETAARRHGVDPGFALAIAQRESAFRQAAISPKGARGVMQLMPGTASRYGADAHDLRQNIDAGVRYLRDLANLFGGDPMLVAAAYNAGERAVIKHGYRIPPYRETQKYVPLVLAARGELHACLPPNSP